ncbi:hypothetical protein [Desulfoferrobacter suflitae]|uniref:hypothetical protein n=1 Tax=Desulfoferrobacter suflitae TaxID=2865782 RepID=UPI002164BAC3|nr:hypothetical protein [Desulfoferrobacter suflitae]MCK8603592.1 hypothetical protein [Desulfoferrobacter suflitae]
MIWHPLLLAVLILDSLSFFMVSAAAVTALRIVISWSPQSAEQHQIRLEVKAEVASVQVRGAGLLFVASSVLFIVAVSNVLPALVPGAMCGTGVLQACRGLGQRALAFRLLTIVIVYVWCSVDRLNRAHPDAPLTTVSGRGCLLLVPVLFLAYLDSVRAVMALDTHQPVDCCAVVYDQVRSLAPATGNLLSLPDAWMVAVFLAAGILLIVLGLRVWRAKSPPSSPLSFALTGLSLLWVPLAYLALIRVLAAYHYQVLYHHCPWCLFLADHHLVGYPLFGALAVTCLEGCVLWVGLKVARDFPQVAIPAYNRSQLAGLSIASATLLFVVLAAGPAMLWRLRFGVWM